MYKLIFCFLFIFSAFKSEAKLQIFVVGDSNCQTMFAPNEDLFFNILEKDLSFVFDVQMINCGIGAMCTGGGNVILDCMYKNFPEEFKPQIAIFTLGINDFGLGVSIQQTYAAIDAFIKTARSNDCIPVIGRIDTSYLYPSKNLENIRIFNDIFDRIKERHDVLMFSYLTPEIMKNPKNHIGDKVHLTSDGHKYVALKLEEVIFSLVANLKK